MPKGYKWGVQFAGRKSKKGRAMGGMIMGIKWEIVEKGVQIETQIEGKIVGRLRTEKERLRIVGVYVNSDLERIFQNMRKWVEEREEGMVKLLEGILMQEQGIGEGERGNMG